MIACSKICILGPKCGASNQSFKDNSNPKIHGTTVFLIISFSVNFERVFTSQLVVQLTLRRGIANFPGIRITDDILF